MQNNDCMEKCELMLLCVKNKLNCNTMVTSAVIRANNVTGVTGQVIILNHDTSSQLTNVL